MIKRNINQVIIIQKTIEIAIAIGSSMLLSVNVDGTSTGCFPCWLWYFSSFSFVAMKWLIARSMFWAASNFCSFLIVFRSSLMYHFQRLDNGFRGCISLASALELLKSVFVDAVGNRLRVRLLSLGHSVSVLV